MDGAGKAHGPLVDDPLETYESMEEEYVTQVENLLNHKEFVREMSSRTSAQRMLQS